MEIHLEFCINYEHSPGYTEFPIKIRGKPVQGFKSYDRTLKQTEKNKDYYFIYVNKIHVIYCKIDFHKIYLKILNKY